MGSSSGAQGGKGRVVAETPGTQGSVLHRWALHTLCGGEDVAEVGEGSCGLGFE